MFQLFNLTLSSEVSKSLLDTMIYKARRPRATIKPEGVEAGQDVIVPILRYVQQNGGSYRIHTSYTPEEQDIMIMNPAEFISALKRDMRKANIYNIYFAIDFNDADFEHSKCSVVYEYADNIKVVKTKFTNQKYVSRFYSCTYIGEHRVYPPSIFSWNRIIIDAKYGIVSGETSYFDIRPVSEYPHRYENEYLDDGITFIAVEEEEPEKPETTIECIRKLEEDWRRIRPKFKDDDSKEISADKEQMSQIKKAISDFDNRCARERYQYTEEELWYTTDIIR